MDTHQNGVFAILTCTEVGSASARLRISWPTKQVTLKRLPVLQPAPSFLPEYAACNEFAAVRVYKPWQDHRNRDQLACLRW